MECNLSPIILFVYNRPWHTEKTLNALKANILSDQSTLYIYADGPKINASSTEIDQINNVRKIIKKEKWCKEVFIIEKSENIGLAQNIITGVTNTIKKHGSVIVLEDDIVTSVGFLKYMNDSLAFYKKNEKVMHISGYMFPHKEELPETFFFNVPLCWGWATWERAWDYFIKDPNYLLDEINKKNLLLQLDKFGSDFLSSQLVHNVSGNINTWFIKWHASVLLKEGFTLYPNISLVDNIGFDRSGVHNGENKNFKNFILSDSIEINNIELKENRNAEIIIKNFYKNFVNKKKYSFKNHIKNILKTILFRFFPKFKK